MTPPAAGITALIAAALTGLVIRVMSISIMAGTVLACVLAVVIGCGIAWLKMPGKGAHAVPRGYAEADERLADTSERVIPRVPTEHAPPWDPAPAFAAAPVIEPAAVTSGPPPQPDAWIVATATLSGGQVTSVQYAAGVDTAPAYFGSAAYTDSKIRAGMGLPPWVAEELGHDSTDDALESMFTRAMARQVRELTDGAS